MSPISEATQVGDERLHTVTHGGIGFDCHGLQCVEEVPGLTGEEPVGGEAFDGGDSAGKSIG